MARFGASAPASSGRHLPPGHRSRVYASLLTIAALSSIAAVLAAVVVLRQVGQVGQPTRDATPPPPETPMELPAASAIGPGAGIYVDYADGSGGMGCTAGFLVRTSTGQPGVLTAGHCNRAGQSSKVTMNLAGILPYATLGTFGAMIYEGVRTEQHDIGLVLLDGDTIPQTSAIGASLPVSGVATDVQLGQRLCKFGMTTDDAECGPALEVTDSKVAFSAPSQCGDSGGPVYLIGPDGTARAVGIDIRGLNPDAKPGPEPGQADTGCAAPAKISVAELVKPWLDQWNLTAVVSAAPSPSSRRMSPGTPRQEGH